MLAIYNSLTRQKEVFKPIKSGSIGIYSCGITVYDYCHLGHARSMVAMDVIVRFLRQNFEVNYVRNITDIDDKIITRAIERGILINALTEEFIAAMHADEQALGNEPPDLEPKATESIEAIIQLIQQLLNKNYAYQATNGDVYFAVERCKDYGKLSNKNLDSLLSGVRIEINKDKKFPLDFVLWKMAKEGEPSWDSPWGSGRPGWHIECSAMAMKHLGEQFDIHGGGLDLQFPHHENEIAQSECATDKTFANYWVHVGLLQINNEKMAKSTGNFLTIADVLKKHNPETIRYFLLSSHYRSPLNYTEDNIANAHKALERLYQSLKDFSNLSDAIADEWVERFNAAMNDDFNTPIALAVLFELSHSLNKTRDPILANTLRKIGNMLGLLKQSTDDFLHGDLSTISNEEINKFIELRLQARHEKNWAKADEIRNKLLSLGIELEDKLEGTNWRRAAR